MVLAQGFAMWRFGLLNKISYLSEITSYIELNTRLHVNTLQYV